jgi:hypothetical protein
MAGVAKNGKWVSDRYVSVVAPNISMAEFVAAVFWLSKWPVCIIFLPNRLG